MNDMNRANLKGLAVSVCKQIVVAGCLTTLVACGGASGDSGGFGGSQPPPRVKRYLGVQLNGVTQPGLVLQTNSGDELAVAENGIHYFNEEVPANDEYAITVKEQPAGQVCTVNNGSGVAETDAMGSVTCSSSAYTIGGQIAGLSAGNQIVLKNNGDDPLIINANGQFTFHKSVAEGGSYRVTVVIQPAGQICSVANGAENNVHANVANVQVDCVAAIAA